MPSRRPGRRSRRRSATTQTITASIASRTAPPMGHGRPTHAARPIGSEPGPLSSMGAADHRRMPVMRSRLDPRSARRAPIMTRWSPRRGSAGTAGRRRGPGAGGDDDPSRATANAASCPSASGSSACWTRARLPRAEPPGRDRPLRRRCAGAGSSPASGGSRGRPASWSPTTPRSGRHLLPDDGQEAPSGPEIALENRLPCIYLVDSGGAFLPLQAEVFPRSRPFRPHLLQPGPDVGRRDPAGRARDGLVARPAVRTSRR